MGPDKRETQPGYYLTGQVVATYIQARPTLQDFGRPRKRDFAKLNLHPGILDQPAKNEFFNRILKFYWSVLRNGILSEEKGIRNLSYFLPISKQQFFSQTNEKTKMNFV